MSEHQKRDWAKTRLHFVCGGLMGAGVGLYFWFDSTWNDSWLIGAAFIIGGGVALGILAGFFLDDFWENFLRLFRWW